MTDLTSRAAASWRCCGTLGDHFHMQMLSSSEGSWLCVENLSSRNAGHGNIVSRLMSPAFRLRADETWLWRVKWSTRQTPSSMKVHVKCTHQASAPFLGDISMEVTLLRRESSLMTVFQKKTNKLLQFQHPNSCQYVYQLFDSE